MIDNPTKRMKLSKKERMKVLNKCNSRCAYCGRELDYDKMQIDHVVPLKRGGSDAIENMLPACRSCNHYKATLTVDGFRKRVESMPDVLMRDSVTFKNAVRFGLVEINKSPVVFYFERKMKENFNGSI